MFDRYRARALEKVRSKIAVPPLNTAYDSGTRWVDVVGESFNQDSIKLVSRFFGRNVYTVLEAETDNPHDRYAVRVAFPFGRKLITFGHLSREIAPVYHKALTEQCQGRGYCPAVITGGRAGASHFGVILDLSYDTSDLVKRLR